MRCIGVLHTIFFHRYFPPIRPSLYTPTATSLSHTHTSSHSQQSLPITLPSILDPPEISTAIDSHTNLLISQLTPQSSAGPSYTSAAAGGSRGEIVVRFYDRKRRKGGITTGWLGRLGGGGQTEEEICWEEWCVQVIVARPRSEAGELSPFRSNIPFSRCATRNSSFRVPPALLTKSLRICDRSNQSPPRHGIVSTKDGHEDCRHCEPRQGSYSPNHYKRPEPLPLQNFRQSQAARRR